MVGGTTDNASDAFSFTRKTHQKIRKLLSPEKQLINRVLRRVLGWGDPFHIWNLIVIWALLAAFGDTDCGNHQQVHHYLPIMLSSPTQKLWKANMLIDT
jgi:hypothetical protein